MRRRERRLATGRTNSTRNSDDGRFQPSVLVGVQANSTRSSASDTSEMHQTRVMHRLGLDHKDPRQLETKQWDKQKPGLTYRPNIRMMKMSGGMTARHNEKLKEKYKDRLLPEVYDVDGDGMIDEWEYKMAEVFRKMRLEDIEDMDGDGDVDEDDLRLAREERGKKMIIKDFLDNLEAPLWQYDRKWIGKRPRDLAKEIIKSKDFCKTMNYLTNKEQLYKLSSSHLMKDSIKNPETTRFADRNLSARGFFKEDRSRCKEKSLLGATRKVHEARPFNKDHGDLPSYGNFSNYKHICIQQGVNLAATGHS